MDWWFFLFFAGLLCQLPGCLLPQRSQVAASIPSAPNFFHWSLIILSPIPHLQFFQETWLSYLHILRNCCSLALCQLSLELLALCAGRERVGISTGSGGRNESYVYIQSSVIRQTANSYSRLFFWWGSDFIFFWRGEVWILSSFWWLFLKPRRPATLAHFTWKGSSRKWRSPRITGREALRPLWGRSHRGSLDAISSVGLRPTLGCFHCPLGGYS